MSNIMIERLNENATSIIFLGEDEESNLLICLNDSGLHKLISALISSLPKDQIDALGQNLQGVLICNRDDWRDLVWEEIHNLRMAQASAKMKADREFFESYLRSQQEN